MERLKPCKVQPPTSATHNGPLMLPYGSVGPAGTLPARAAGRRSIPSSRTRRIWFCYVWKKQFTLKVGTIMEDSALGVDKWMTALWMLANWKNGISSYELARTLGIRQNSAWFMLHRIREGMKDDPEFQFGGPNSEVESNEIFDGPRGRYMHKDKKIRLAAIRGQGKRGDVFLGRTAVHGILDRELQEVRCNVIPNVKRDVLQNEILKYVERGSKVYTDESSSCDTLIKELATKSSIMRSGT